MRFTKTRAGSVSAAIAAAVAASLTIGPSQSQAAGNAITVPPVPVIVANPVANPAQVAGTVKVSNLPATQAVAGTVNVGNLPATQSVSGTVAVSNLPDVQKVEVTNLPTVGGTTGPVEVSNFPATQQVAGTVSIDNLPATQQVEGTVSVGNLPAVQQVTGTVNENEASGGLYMQYVTGTGPGFVTVELPSRNAVVKAQMSVWIIVEPGDVPFAFLYLQGSAGDDGYYQTYVPMSLSTSVGSLDIYSGEFPQPLYMAIGYGGRLFVQTTKGGQVTANIAMNGVYVD